MLNFSEEVIEKAMQAKSVEELIVIAKESDMELTEEQAQVYFAQLNPQSGELADEELDNVAGGGCASLSSCYDGWTCRTCGSKSHYTSPYNSGGEFCINCDVRVTCNSCMNYVSETGSCSFQ